MSSSMYAGVGWGAAEAEDGSGHYGIPLERGGHPSGAAQTGGVLGAMSIRWPLRPGGSVCLGSRSVLAQNHPFPGLDNAIRAMLQARAEGHGRSGVFWQTQGPGKSCSRVFFAQKVMRKLPGNFVAFTGTPLRVDQGVPRRQCECSVRRYSQPKTASLPPWCRCKSSPCRWAWLWFAPNHSAKSIGFLELLTASNTAPGGVALVRRIGLARVACPAGCAMNSATRSLHSAVLHPGSQRQTTQHITTHRGWRLPLEPEAARGLAPAAVRLAP